MKEVKNISITNKKGGLTMIPNVCPSCGGTGIDVDGGQCPDCYGSGENEKD